MRILLKKFSHLLLIIFGEIHKMIKTKRDTIGYLSQRGHRGFYYPDETNPVILLKGADLERLHWVGSHLVATCAKAGDISLFSDKDERKVSVWIRKENLE